jgi:DNA-binding CsgD family transcriptional regulator
MGTAIATIFCSVKLSGRYLQLPLVSQLADYWVTVSEPCPAPRLVPRLSTQPEGTTPFTRRGKNKKQSEFKSFFRLHSQGVQVKLIRRSDQPHPFGTARTALPRNIYFFCEKSTGAAHFQLEATPDGNLPVDKAAGLLAMHCMVRGHAPSDYLILVQAGEKLAEGLHEKAGILLEAGKSIRSKVSLTRREEEVLSGLMKSLSNKEIAANLNLSERTVKFHVSSLLSKFRVRGRMELVREASRQGAASMVMPIPSVETEDISIVEAAKSFPDTRRTAAIVPLAKRAMGL